MSFDPEHERRFLINASIPVARESVLLERLARHTLTRTAQAIQLTSIQCCRMGLFDAALELFLKARDFFKAAIDQREIPFHYFPAGTEAARYEQLALCEWFIRGEHDRESLKLSVEWQEQWFSGMSRTNKADVQEELVPYLDAEEYEKLVERFEVAGLKAPKNLRHIQGQGTMAYVMACHRLGRAYTDDEIQDALARFLKWHVPTWCTKGWDRDLARWMKIAFWKPGADPIATFLKCYDFLPGLTAPEYHANVVDGA